METELHFEKLWLTPERARALLDDPRRPSNRLVSPQRVARYTQAILAGQWALTGDPIKLDGDGLLIDGQHRCAAVIAANLPIRTVIAHNVTDPLAFDAFDLGGQRTNGDRLGVLRVPNRKTCAAALRWLVALETGPSSLRNLPFVQPYEQKALLAQEPEIVDVISRRDKALSPVFGAGRPGVLALAHWLIKRHHGRATHFFDRLSDGVGLDAGDPILVLRLRMHQERASARSLPPWVRLAMVVHTWNRYYRGARTRQLRHDLASPFPELAGGSPWPASASEHNSSKAP